jgi:hypothetical protein
MIRVTALGTQRRRSLQAFRTKWVVKISRRSTKYRAFQFSMASSSSLQKTQLFSAGLYVLAFGSTAQKMLVTR